MKQTTSNTFRFYNCQALAGEKPLALVAAGLYKPQSKEDESTCVFLVDDTRQVWNMSVTAWPSIASFLVQKEDDNVIINIGFYGHIQRYSQIENKVYEDQLPEVPPIHIRGADIIDEYLYVYGLGPVYRTKTSELNAWEPVNKGLPENFFLPDGKPFGFDAITQFRDSLLAVGVQGVIYRYESDTWQALSSPTQAWLHGVLVTPAHEIYACGKGGIFHSTDGRDFQPLDLGVKHTFRALAWYKDQCYVVRDNRLFLLKDKTLTGINMPLLDEVSAISVSGDHLWAVGGQQIAWSADGNEWQLVVFESKVTQ